MYAMHLIQLMTHCNTTHPKPVRLDGYSLLPLLYLSRTHFTPAPRAVRITTDDCIEFEIKIKIKKKKIKYDFEDQGHDPEDEGRGHP